MRSLSLRDAVVVGAVALLAVPACSSNSNNRPKPVGQVSSGGSAGAGAGGSAGSGGSGTGGGSPSTGGSSGASTGGAAGNEASGGTTSSGGSAAGGSSGAGSGGTGAGGTSSGGTAAGGSSGSGGTAAGGSSGSGGTGTGGSAGTGGSSGSGGADGGVSSCAGQTVLGFGTKDLVPVAPTPNAFAQAYTAEVQSMSDPGPLLIVIKFTSPVDSWFGSLVPGTSSDYKFGQTPAEVPITLSQAFSLSLSASPVQFSLHFATSDTQADIPVIAVGGDGILSGSCGSIGFDKLTMAIPSSAGSIQFHGASLSSLLGTPIPGQNGQPSAWIIQFDGGAKQVSYQGGIP